KKHRNSCMLTTIWLAGHYGQRDNAPYSAGKAGLLNMVRASAMDLAHFGIRVHTITPYAMEQNIFRSGPSPVRPGPGLRLRYTVSSDDFLKSIPMGRFPRASDTAYAAVFLASHEADFVTGIDLPV